MSTPRKAPMQQEEVAPHTSQTPPSHPVEYFDYHETNGVATGLARYEDPQGGGRFLLRVSGPPEAVQGYGAQARILTLRVVHDQNFAQEEAERRTQRVARVLQACEKRCAALRDLLEQYASLDFAALPDEARAQYEALMDEQPEHDGAIPKLTRDRLIEIEPDGWMPEFPYQLILRLDPTVGAGRCDIYCYSGDDGTIGSLTATLDTGGNNPDLYLYRGGYRKDSSENGPGFDETVWGEGGSGRWRLHVFGRGATANYTLSAVWRIHAEEVSNRH